MGERIFEGKRVMITGTGGGIGKALVERFASEGADIVAHARADKEGHSEEKRTITMINRALDYAPADRIKDMPLSPIFILLDQYITSGDVKRKLHREYVQDLDDSPAKVQREREADNKASTYVVAESGKGLQKIDFENLYREAKLAEIRKGLDRLLKEENEKEKPKEKKLLC